MIIIQPRWIVHKDKESKNDTTIFSLNVHPDGKRLATGGLDSNVKIWATEPIFDGEKEADESCHKLLSTLTGHGGAVLCVRWSTHGHYLASSSDDTVVMIWQRDQSGLGGGKVFGSDSVNHEAYKVVRRLAGHTSDVTAVAWDDDDRYLATGGLDSMVLVYDARSFQCIRRLAGHTGFVKGVVWDPVGEFLASQSDDKSVKIWRTTDWGLESSIEGCFEDAPTASFCMRLSWSPDGTHITTPNSTNNGVFVAAVTDRYAWQSNVSLVGHPNVVEATAFNPLIFMIDAEKGAEPGNLSTLIAVAGRSSVSLWYTSRPRPLIVMHSLFDRDILDLAWSKDGTCLYCCSSEGHVCCIRFTIDELLPVVPEGTREAYHKTFGFSKPALPALPSMPVFSQPQQIRAPSPQKTTIVNGKRRIQPSFIAQLASETTYVMPDVPASRPSLSREAALEARMLGARESQQGITTSGFDAPVTRLPAETPSRKRRATSSLLLGPEEDAGPSRLPPAQPRGAKSRAPGQSITWTSVNQPVELEPAQEWEPLALDDVKLEVPPVKSFASVAMSFGDKSSDVERLEWRNYAGKEEPSEVVQVSGDKTTPLWLDYLPSNVLLGVLNSSFSAVACSDSSLSVYSPTGRHMLPVIKLDAPCAFLDSAGAFLLAVTASGRLHVWNVFKTVAAFDPLHLHALLARDGKDKVVSVTVRPNGTPVVALSDGNAFAFDASLRSWTRLSATPWYARGSDQWETRARGRTLSATRGVVRHMEGAVNDLLVSFSKPDDAMQEDVEGESLPRAGEKADFGSALALGHAEARLASAISLGSASEYKQFLLQYAQRIADEGFRAKGEELVHELLGPVYYKPGQSESWSPTVLGMQKRDLLRDVLSVFAKSMALKKLSTETIDLLRKVAAEE